MKTAVMPPPATVEEAAASSREGKESSGVQSLVRAFGILEEIARHQNGINLADLSKAVGLHNSTAFHLVRTMATLGYVRQNADNKRYYVGNRVFGLAANCSTELELA